MLPVFRLSPSRFHIRALFTAIVMLFTLNGCASMVLSPVTKENRDTSVKFNGSYTVTQHKAALKQTIEQWVFTCPNFQKEQRYTLAARDGEIKIFGIGSRPIYTYVDSDGKFRAEVPLGGTVKESAGSDASINRGKRNLIVRGRINTGKSSSGLITVGVEQFGYSGCSARLTFEKK